MAIPHLVSQERVLNAIPPWLRLICTTRRDAKVLAEFRFPVPLLLEIDAQSSASKADVSAYIQQRIRTDSAIAAAVSSYAAQEFQQATNDSKALNVMAT